MLRLSSHYHQKNTMTGRSMATSIARRFAWDLPEFSDQQMNSAHYFLKHHLLLKTSWTMKQNVFLTYTCSTTCSSCDFKSTRENLLLDIDTVTSEITTKDPIEFIDHFYAHHILNPRPAKCNSKDCANNDATQENIITKYSPFLLIGAAMWNDPESNRIHYTNFPYEMKFDDANYMLHSKVHSVTNDGFHFYIVATIEYQSERFLARFDNLKPGVEIITNRVSQTSQEVLCQPDKTTLVCYKLSTINKIHPTLMDILEINESDAVLSPLLIGSREGSRNIETYGLRPMSYIQQVLIPETGALLIREDIKEARRDNKLNEFDMMQVEHAGDEKLLEYA
ncbi:hypothetical protein INT45_014179 [Circinella minor]|uniref:Uncharacterized protein n=1 Tax=Circinella minor TaxID=1195481 RepID=A0A8H7RTH6_9FUNG|nr:hypothetical protein INT45_014179 [Circinella minor]